MTNLTDNAGQTIADIVAKEVGNIGENIKASRAVCLTSTGEHEHIAHYLHNAGQLLYLLIPDHGSGFSRGEPMAEDWARLRYFCICKTPRRLPVFDCD